MAGGRRIDMDARQEKYTDTPQTHHRHTIDRHTPTAHHAEHYRRPPTRRPTAPSTHVQFFEQDAARDITGQFGEAVRVELQLLEAYALADLGADRLELVAADVELAQEGELPDAVREEVEVVVGDVEADEVAAPFGWNGGVVWC